MSVFRIPFSLVDIGIFHIQLHFIFCFHLESSHTLNYTHLANQNLGSGVSVVCNSVLCFFCFGGLLFCIFFFFLFCFVLLFLFACLILFVCVIIVVVVVLVFFLCREEEWIKEWSWFFLFSEGKLNNSHGSTL